VRGTRRRGECPVPGLSGVKPMSSYMLRNMPPELFKAAKDKAATEGHNLKWVILQLLTYYVKAGLPR
jgi:hypothetical protein